MVCQMEVSNNVNKFRHNVKKIFLTYYEKKIKICMYTMGGLQHHRFILIMEL